MTRVTFAIDIETHYLQWTVNCPQDEKCILEKKRGGWCYVKCKLKNIPKLNNNQQNNHTGNESNKEQEQQQDNNNNNIKEYSWAVLRVPHIYLKLEEDKPSFTEDDLLPLECISYKENVTTGNSTLISVGTSNNNNRNSVTSIGSRNSSVGSGTINSPTTKKIINKLINNQEVKSVIDTTTITNTTIDSNDNNKTITLEDKDENVNNKENVDENITTTTATTTTTLIIEEQQQSIETKEKEEQKEEQKEEEEEQLIIIPKNIEIPKLDIIPKQDIQDQQQEQSVDITTIISSSTTSSPIEEDTLSLPTTKTTINNALLEIQQQDIYNQLQQQSHDIYGEENDVDLTTYDAESSDTERDEDEDEEDNSSSNQLNSLEEYNEDFEFEDLIGLTNHIVNNDTIIDKELSIYEPNLDSQIIEIYKTKLDTVSNFFEYDEHSTDERKLNFLKHIKLQHQSKKMMGPTELKNSEVKEYLKNAKSRGKFENRKATFFTHQSPLLIQDLQKKYSVEQAAKIVANAFHYYYTTSKLFEYAYKSNEFKQQRLRQACIKEILTTERAYVNQLEILYHDFYLPLQRDNYAILYHSNNTTINNNLNNLNNLNTNMNNILKYTPEEQFKYMFSNIEQILQTNTALLHDLEIDFKKNWPQNFFPSIFKKILPFLKIYTTYVNNYENASEIIEYLMKTNSKFNDLNESVYERKGITIQSLLITPVQRIPRYKLLFEELFKRTCKEHVEYNVIEETLILISELATFVNEKKRNERNNQIMINLQQQLEKRYKSLIKPKRKFIKKDSFKIIISSLQNNNITTTTLVNKVLFNNECDVYLFNDILLIIPLTIEGGYKIDFTKILFLSFIDLEKRKGGEEEFKDEEMIHFEISAFIRNCLMNLKFIALNSDIRMKWEKDLSELIEIEKKLKINKSTIMNDVVINNNINNTEVLVLNNNNSGKEGVEQQTIKSPRVHVKLSTSPRDSTNSNNSSTSPNTNLQNNLSTELQFQEKRKKLYSKTIITENKLTNNKQEQSSLQQEMKCLNETILQLKLKISELTKELENKIKIEKEKEILLQQLNVNVLQLDKEYNCAKEELINVDSKIMSILGNDLDGFYELFASDPIVMSDKSKPPNLEERTMHSSQNQQHSNNNNTHHDRHVSNNNQQQQQLDKKVSSGTGSLPTSLKRFSEVFKPNSNNNSTSPNSNNNNSSSTMNHDGATTTTTTTMRGSVTHRSPTVFHNNNSRQTVSDMSRRKTLLQKAKDFLYLSSQSTPESSSSSENNNGREVDNNNVMQKSNSTGALEASTTMTTTTIMDDDNTSSSGCLTSSTSSLNSNQQHHTSIGALITAHKSKQNNKNNKTNNNNNSTKHRRTLSDGIDKKEEEVDLKKNDIPSPLSAKVVNNNKQQQERVFSPIFTTEHGLPTLKGSIYQLPSLPKKKLLDYHQLQLQQLQENNQDKSPTSNNVTNNNTINSNTVNGNNDKSPTTLGNNPVMSSNTASAIISPRLTTTSSNNHHLLFKNNNELLTKEEKRNSGEGVKVKKIVRLVKKKVPASTTTTNTQQQQTTTIINNNEGTITTINKEEEENKGISKEDETNITTTTTIGNSSNNNNNSNTSIVSSTTTTASEIPPPITTTTSTSTAVIPIITTNENSNNNVTTATPLKVNRKRINLNKTPSATTPTTSSSSSATTPTTTSTSFNEKLNEILLFNDTTTISTIDTTISKVENTVSNVEENITTENQHCLSSTENKQESEEELKSKEPIDIIDKIDTSDKVDFDHLPNDIEQLKSIILKLKSNQ